MKTFNELGISEQEYNALIKVRDMLNTHAPDAVQLHPVDNDTPAVQQSYTIDGFGLFNMGVTTSLPDVADMFTNDERAAYHCGTVGCIGGWVSLVMQGVFNPARHKGPVIVDVQTAGKADQYVNRQRWDGTSLRTLFYPPQVHDKAWHKITPAHAVHAINNFLEYGMPDWRTVLADTDIYSKDI